MAESRHLQVVVVLPPSVEAECASIGVPQFRQRNKLTMHEKLALKQCKEQQRTGQTFLSFDSDDFDPELEKLGFNNIHHALKAHVMRFGIPTQLIWESTLNVENQASLAWNLFTALYYKSGSSPWRLQALPDDTCYVGVSFFKEGPQTSAQIQSSLAQVFGAGEGIVIRGEKAVFDENRDKRPHLSREGARSIILRAIRQFSVQHGVQPKRLVVHKTSRYWPEELQGMKEALGDIYQYDLLAIEQSNVRFFRIGRNPPLRGTCVILSDGNYLVFGNGYIPYLRCYPGKRIPRPIEVIEHHGISTPETVCREILALTKLNWNSCAFGSSSPITIRFARDVGKIISELPEGVTPECKYKFYM